MTDFEKTKQLLEEKLGLLIARADEIDDDLRQPGDDDWEEHAVETADDEVLEKMGSVTLDEIRQIKLALSRLEAGTYGICVSCGSKIAKERLKILPYSTRCVTCC